jgi:hypothetical protein
MGVATVVSAAVALPGLIFGGRGKLLGFGGRVVTCLGVGVVALGAVAGEGLADPLAPLVLVARFFEVVVGLLVLFLPLMLDACYWSSNN